MQKCFVILVEAIIYLLLYNLSNLTFTYKKCLYKNEKKKKTNANEINEKN